MHGPNFAQALHSIAFRYLIGPKKFTQKFLVQKNPRLKTGHLL